MGIQIGEIHNQIPGKEHILGLAGATDRYGISGFAFSTRGSALPCGISVASFAVPFVIRIHGDVEEDADFFFKERIYRAIDLLGVCDLVLDLTYCDFIDSRGLALLIGLYHRLNPIGCQVRLANPYPRLRVTLRNTGLDKIFAFVD